MKNGVKAFVFGAFAALLAAGCGNLLSVPPSTLSITITEGPTEVPTYNSATLSWQTSTQCVYSIEYGTVSGTYINAVPKSTTAASSHTMTIYSLDQSTTYYYRIVSYYQGVRPFPSEEYSFTTTVAPGLAISVGPTVTPAQTSLDIVWTTNVAARHLIEYGTAPSTYGESTLTSPAMATGHSETLTGLNAGVTYYYRIRHFWDSGSDTVSGEYTAGTTAEPAPTLAQRIRGVWMVGGVSGGTVGTVVNQIDLFDPVTNAWYPSVTSFTAGGMTPISFGGAVGYTRPVDGHHLIIVIGGFDGAGNTTNAVQIYDVDTNTWSGGTAMTQSRVNFHAVRIYDKVYVLGGSGAAGATTATTPWAGNSTSYEYSIGSSWNTRVAFSATAGTERFTYAYNDVVYNLLGRNGAITFAAAAHDGISVLMNLLTTGVTELVVGAPYSTRAGVAGAVWAPGTGPAYVIMVGGYTGITNATGQYFITNNVTGSTPSAQAVALAYPFTAPLAWGTATVPAYPLAIGLGAAAVYGNTFYYFGGTTTLIPASASGSASLYTLALSGLPTILASWTAGTNMPVGRYGHSAVTFPQ